MSYIYLDESGDLGFDFSKLKASKYFVLTFLFVKRKRPIEKVVKKVFKDFSRKEIKQHKGVLHCVKEHPRTRLRLLTLLTGKEISILSIYLNKSKVYTRLQDEKHVLYNYVANILLDRICTKKLIPTNQPITLVASRRETNKFLNQNFRDYLERQSKDNFDLKLKIEIKTPYEEKCLQVTDFLCWAIFRKREHNDESYYNIIKSKIIEESGLFP